MRYTTLEDQSMAANMHDNMAARITDNLGRVGRTVNYVSSANSDLHQRPVFNTKQTGK